MGRPKGSKNKTTETVKSVVQLNEDDKILYRKLTDYLQEVYLQTVGYEPPWALFMTQIKDIKKNYDINYDVILLVFILPHRNRTAADVRHYFDKYGGNLGTTGCVSYMFADKGVIAINGEGIDEEQLMMDALEAGAEDITNEDGIFEITTDPADFSAVSDALTNAGYTFISAEQSKIPANYVELTDEDAIKNMEKLLDMLDDNDDVTNIWHNWEA